MSNAVQPALSPASHRSSAVYALIGAAVFMTFLDQWVVNVALEAIGRDLSGGSLSGLSWIINAYTITLAALFIIAGRIGDRSGHRRLFLWGTALFTVASLGCALAPNLSILIVFRVAQAAGAAVLLPTSLSLLLQHVPAHHRHNAARLWSATGALAAASGPVLGGLLIDTSWRWVFMINIPIGIVVVAAGNRVFAESQARTTEPLPDLFGSVILVIGVAALIGAIVQGPEWGWRSGRGISLTVVALLLLVWFIQRCATQPTPLFELSLWRIPTFAIANVGIVLFSLSFAIMLLSNALWCQGVWGYSALKTGLAMAPGPAIVPFVTIASNRLIRRIGVGPTVALGCLLFAGGQFWRVLAADANGSYVSDLLPSMLLVGIGNGLAFSTMIASGTTALPENRSATGSGVLNTGRQIASAIGVALLVANLGGELVNAESVSAFRTSWALSAGFVTLAAVVTIFLPRLQQSQTSIALVGESNQSFERAESLR